VQKKPKTKERGAQRLFFCAFGARDEKRQNTIETQKKVRNLGERIHGEFPKNQKYPRLNATVAATYG